MAVSGGSERFRDTHSLSNIGVAIIWTVSHASVLEGFIEILAVKASRHLHLSSHTPS